MAGKYCVLLAFAFSTNAYAQSDCLHNEGAATLHFDHHPPASQISKIFLRDDKIQINLKKDGSGTVVYYNWDGRLQGYRVATVDLQNNTLLDEAQDPAFKRSPQKCENRGCDGTRRTLRKRFATIEAEMKSSPKGDNSLALAFLGCFRKRMDALKTSSISFRRDER